MTGNRGFVALGVLFTCGLLHAATAAGQVPSINVGTAAGIPGQTVTFSVTLSSGGAQVAATENDISFDASTPVGVVTTGQCGITIAQTCSVDTDCPALPPPFTGNEACSLPPPGGRPDCSVNPALGKGGFFNLLPDGCAPTSPGSCTGLRALIITIDYPSAIPDGSTLYSCNVSIASNASTGDHPLTISNESAGTQVCSNNATKTCTADTDCTPGTCTQVLIAGVTGTDGTITVGPEGPLSPTPTSTAVPSATATNTTAPSPSVTATSTATAAATLTATATPTPFGAAPTAVGCSTCLDDGCQIGTRDAGYAWLLLIPAVGLLMLRAKTLRAASLSSNANSDGKILTAVSNALNGRAAAGSSHLLSVPAETTPTPAAIPQTRCGPSSKP